MRRKPAGLALLALAMACTKPGANTATPPASRTSGDAEAPAPAPAAPAGVAAPGASVVTMVEGGGVVLFREAGRARAYVARSTEKGPPFAFDVARQADRQPVFPGGGPLLDARADAELVPLLVRPERAWFSLVERQPASGDLRVRLVERDERGVARVVEEHEVSRGEERRPTPYDRAGKVAVVALGDSVYAFTRRALVLSGPGAMRSRFEEQPDADCPAEKRCFLRRPTYDLTRLVGVAPNGSFVTAGSGLLLRVETRGAAGYGYDAYAASGAVADHHVTLLHAASSPAEVVRWFPPPPPTKGPTPPPPESDLPRGTPTVLGKGSFSFVAEDASGDAYALRTDGAVVQLTGASAGTIYEPAGGCRATDLVGAGEHAIAWVVRCEPSGRASRHFVMTR